MCPADPLPASAAWREGDAAAWRRFADIGPLPLELGGHLPDVRVAFETWGTLSPARDNAILVEHALTGDAHVAGPAAPGQPTSGWWDRLVGPGRPLDTDRWYIVCANVLGGCQGTTGPASVAPDGRVYGSRWPRITIRDQVEVEARLADVLGIDRFALVLGGSMGGMRTLEWLLMYPDRVRTAMVIATGAAATADQIATQSIQIEAIRTDPAWNGGDYHGTGQTPWVGMGLARRIAHLTYLTDRELQRRFNRDNQPGEDALDDGRFAVESYLDHQADKFVHRFDPGSYVSLSDAMSLHDVYRGRGLGVLSTIENPVRIVGIDSDRLYPLHLQQAIADEIGVDLDVIESPYGHDGFLLETDAVGRLVAEMLCDLGAPACR